jgi:hypothetical protein
MQTYLLALFATAAVLLGLAVGLLVAFAQMAAGRFSPAVASLVFRDRIVWVLLFIPTSAMLLLGVASLIVSLPPPRPTLPWLTLSQTRLTVGVGALVSVVVSIACVVGLAVRAATYNSGPSLARRLVRAVPIRAIVAQSQNTTEAALRERHRSYPFLPIFELLNQAVRDGDRSTFARTLQAVRDEWPGWLQAAGDGYPRRSLVTLVRDAFLADVSELIKRYGVPSLHRLYLPEVATLAMIAYDRQPDLLAILLNHLERTVVTLLLDGEDEPGASGVNSLFRIEAHLSNDQDVAVNVHQTLGSVGRAIGPLLPSRDGFAFETGGFGYLDESRSPSVAQLREGYYELCQRHKKAADKNDHLIWLEAMEVAAITLLRRGVETTKFRAIKEHFVSLAIDMAGAASDLAYKQLERTINTTIFGLDRFAQEDIPAEQTDIWLAIANAIVGLGMVAEDLNIEFWGGGHSVDRAIDAFGRVPPEHWDSAVLEGLIRGINDKPDHDARWRFITKAGGRLGTNFGLMFDPDTGQIYPDDDPRRH